MASGLDDVIAADTALSDVDGLAGKLIVRGHSLDALAGRISFEEMVALLFDGLVDPIPTAADLGEARKSVFDRFAGRLDMFAALPVFDGLRAAIAQLPDDVSAETAALLLAAPAVLVPALVRRRRGEAAAVPSPELGHAADILRMLRRCAGASRRARALDAYLVTVADHGLNASTFTARVVASTQAGLTSSVVAALGALKGPLHGGAPGPVLDMLDAVGTPGTGGAGAARRRSPAASA